MKLPQPHLVDSEQAHEMLYREAAICSRVSHPNLCVVLAAGFETEPSYVVQPRIRGASVAQALKSAGRFSPPHALWIARQISAALGCLHKAGWVHGDVKPDNILVDRQGHATLVDLGFAFRPPSPSDRFAGTLNYAAPERLATDSSAAFASDVFSLGSTLFEMLVGRVPDSARNATDSVTRQLRSRAPDAPRSVAGLIARMMDNDPDRRPTADDLTRIITTLEIESLEQRAG